MTFGEMRAWTERFNQICGAALMFKYQRLDNMLNDLVLAHGPHDDHARQLYLAVMDEMEV
ncbi:hypothetical protein M3638_03075 [Oceanobacillus profundus]|uniref:hypothetical protein n=1 Tax=Oceanobacillus profundus TaxID=372463 RepID=UPI00203A9D91|nr:hypothetical protein [Oceanobacillus profundus]MCM3396822.1 hypothetical protein [Oceanobacillus profundus]